MCKMKINLLSMFRTEIDPNAKIMINEELKKYEKY